MGGNDLSNRDDVQTIAASGISGARSALPHLDKIQESFGSHDVTSVRAHHDAKAAAATTELGAEAYATGNDVAFANSSPDLKTAAHEAAHVVQQQAGIQLKGGVGQVDDVYERHADAVADRVVAGESAENLLGEVAGNDRSQTRSSVPEAGFVQLLGKSLNTVVSGDGIPAHGEAPCKERSYSVEQYIEMWEEEQGRELSDAERKTLYRGCIGMLALNLTGGGNPPLDNVYNTFEQAHAVMVDMNDVLRGYRTIPTEGAASGKRVAILFAKLFWSNQAYLEMFRGSSDRSAFRPDPESGRVDMSDYKYRARPGFVNYDYGFWDESTATFWRANHSQPGMKVYQSSRERLAEAYADFDRIVYGVAIAENYDPTLAAQANVKPAPLAEDDSTAASRISIGCDTPAQF